MLDNQRLTQAPRSKFHANFRLARALLCSTNHANVSLGLDFVNNFFCANLKKNVAPLSFARYAFLDMNTKEAINFVGGFSAPSKMPCHSYSTPAARCVTGAKLANVKGSICASCYALRGNYRFGNVQKALERRLESLSSPLWVEAMTQAIGGWESSGFFRWHDSGDIQSLEHLEKIAQVASNLPHISFWLPTREYAFVSAYVAKHGAFPSNLTVRLSAYMVEGNPPAMLAKRLGVQTSGVSKTGFTCPSSTQGNKCLSCRACWDKTVENVNYKKH